MLIQGNAVAWLAQQLRQRGLALLYRRPPQVVAVEQIDAHFEFANFEVANRSVSDRARNYLPSARADITNATMCWHVVGYYPPRMRREIHSQMSVVVQFRLTGIVHDAGSARTSRRLLTRAGIIIVALCSE